MVWGKEGWGVENAKILVPGWLPRDLTIVRHEMTTPLI